MKRLLGSNQYEDKYRLISKDAERSVWMVATLCLLGVIFFIKTQPAIISPLADSPVCSSIGPPKTADYLVDFYSSRYGKNRWDKLVIKVKLHFLLLKESAYGGTKSCGDGGLACGPLQYHLPTWFGFRKIMLAQRLITEIGNRENLEQSIETTAWAIANGRELNWGPLARKEIIL